VKKVARAAFRISVASAISAVLVAGVCVQTIPAARAAGAFGVEERSVAELGQLMRERKVDAQRLVSAYLTRIAALDDAGPQLNAVIEINPLAMDEARERDAEIARGEWRGPMHGIPVLLKDNMDAQPMATSAGSLALADHRPGRDAFVVTRLRDAGAVILGKTNLSEWANFRSTRSTSGWSSRGGQTRNPYALDRNPCGSSSGSGVAVAASLATVAVGTETDGSIICPSAVNGLVGLKPTIGLVSRHGIVPISPSQDTAGPMARSVADAAALLTAMSGFDPRDAASSQREGVDYVSHLKPGSLRGARLGVMRATTGFHPDVDAAFERALVAMTEAGAQLVDPADLATQGEWNDAEFDVLLYEFRPALEAYLRESGAPLTSLDELVEFNRVNSATAMRWFGQELFEAAAAKGPLSERRYRRAHAKARRLAGRDGIVATLRKHRLDALIAPAVGPAWVTDPVSGDHFLGAGYGAAAVAGTPSLTVPMGDVHGLPIGLAFLGAAWSEARLIELAHDFEQRTHSRRPPSYRASIDE
jgi:amidase